jgi:hypothetical protein
MCPFQSPASSLQRPSVYLPDTSASPFCPGFALNGQTQEKKRVAFMDIVEDSSEAQKKS